MLFRRISLALMSISIPWSTGAAIATAYACSFYKDEVPQNDLQPAWIALLVGLFSVAVAAAIFGANRDVKRRTIEAFEVAHGAFVEENHRLDEPCQYLEYIRPLIFLVAVPWIVLSLKSMNDSSNMEREDYKIFSMAAHFINILASAAFSILIGHLALVDAEVVYTVSQANVPNQVRPQPRVMPHHNGVGHAGPNFNNVQLADPAGQQIELQELNHVEAPLQIQNHE